MTPKMQFELAAAARMLIRAELTDHEPGWWTRLIVPYLARHNQERAWKMGDRYLDLMDLSEAICVLIGQWDIIADRYGLSPRYVHLLQHVRSARNAAAHRAASGPDSMDAWDASAAQAFLDLVCRLTGSCAAA